MRLAGYLKRRVDVVGLLGLGVVALGARALKALRLHPAVLKQAGRFPDGPRRVVLFIPSLGMGGAQRQLVSFLTHLDRKRWEPELVTLKTLDNFFESEVRALDVPITYLNPQDGCWMSGVVWRLRCHLRARPCHILHNWMHWAVALGAIAGAMAGVPTILGSLRSQKPSRFPWHYPKWQRGIDMLAVQLSTCLIVNSNAAREEARRWALVPERKLLRVYNGIDIEGATLLGSLERDQLKAELKAPKEAPLVGIVGRLDPEKDHATFLEAARLISRTRPDARFLIVGEGPTRSGIESEIVREGISNRVHVLGMRKDAQRLIQILDVLVLTSTSEGLPNVLLEAAVAGTPVVTTAAGGAAEVVLDGETGFVVRVGDAGSIARRVVELLDDRGLSRRLAEAARERAREVFSADQATRAVEACYEQAGGRHRADRINTPRLRVCFISYNAYGLLQQSSGIQWGGAEIQICSLGRELARDPRFNIYIVTGDGLRTGREQYGKLTVVLGAILGKHQYRVISGWLRFAEQGKRWLNESATSLTATIRSLVRATYAVRRWLFALSFIRWLVDREREYREVLGWVRLLRSVDADVHVMRCACPQVGDVQRACGFLRRKFVYMVAHDYDVSGEFVRANGELGKRYERGLQCADEIVCQHEGQVNVVRTRYGREARLMRSLSPFPVHAPSSACRKTILWIARVDSWKQPDIFIELARRLPEESFAMVAQPSRIEPHNLPRLLAAAAGLPNLCLFEGVPFERTAALFAEAKLFINTSQDEGFPNTFLQAAASGTPIVSWAVNPEGILDRYQMGYCADGEWARFEQCVHLLCEDEALRERMGDNGRRYVQEHHDPATIAAQYAELFLTLRDGRPSVPTGFGERRTPRVLSGGAS